MADLQELARAAISEWLACDCPHGMCDVYPHPAMKALAEAVGWQPPEGVQPWGEGT
jgi:hypothetical protein